MAFAGCDLYTNEAIAALTPRDPRLLSKHYLRFALAGMDCAEDSSHAVKGKTLNQDGLRALSIPLPPLAEQERIAGRLTEGLAAVERARAAAQARLSAAEALPAAYLREVFEGPESAGWEIVAVRDFADVSGGLQKQPKRFAHTFHRPYLTVRNVQRGSLDLSHVERFEITPSELERLRLEPGDILIVEGNGSPDQIGRNAVFELEGEEWIHQNHVIRVRLSGRADHHFVSKYLNSDAGRLQMLERAQSTSGLYTLSVEKVNSLEVPLPPLPDQRRIAADLQTRLAGAEHLTATLRAELAAVEALPAALLRGAFGGGPDHPDRA
jgi:type I restriction enzyme S subunit